jgi:hypothetical protein
MHSSTVTRLLAACFAAQLIWGTIFFSLVGLPLYRGFLPFLYFQTLTMSSEPFSAALVAKYAVVCYFSMAGVLYELVPLLFARRDTKRVPLSNNTSIGVIIPVYRAAKPLPATLTALLKVFKPWQVLVLDNGRDATKRDATPEVCDAFGVQCVFFEGTGKAGAEYVGLHIMKHFEWILQIDDDTHIHPEMSFPLSDDIDGVAYLVQAELHTEGVQLNWYERWLIECQKLEFANAGMLKTWMNQIGQVDFAHVSVTCSLQSRGDSTH